MRNLSKRIIAFFVIKISYLYYKQSVHEIVGNISSLDERQQFVERKTTECQRIKPCFFFGMIETIMSSIKEEEVRR